MSVSKQKLIVLNGPSSSGKSRWAAEQEKAGKAHVAYVLNDIYTFHGSDFPVIVDSEIMNAFDIEVKRFE